jgi:hypothetical protein
MNFEDSLVGWILDVKNEATFEQQLDHTWIRKKAENLVDMVVQGSSKSKIIIRFNCIYLYSIILLFEWGLHAHDPEGGRILVPRSLVAILVQAENACF